MENSEWFFHWDAADIRQPRPQIQNKFANPAPYPFANHHVKKTAPIVAAAVINATNN